MSACFTPDGFDTCLLLVVFRALMAFLNSCSRSPRREPWWMKLLDSKHWLLTLVDRICLTLPCMFFILSPRLKVRFIWELLTRGGAIVPRFLTVESGSMFSLNSMVSCHRVGLSLLCSLNTRLAFVLRHVLDSRLSWSRALIIFCLSWERFGVEKWLSLASSPLKALLSR